MEGGEDLCFVSLGLDLGLGLGLMGAFREMVEGDPG